MRGWLAAAFIGMLLAGAAAASQIDFAASSVTEDGGDLAISLHIGTSAPFRLMLLDDPKRLVIDIKGVEPPRQDPSQITGADLLDAVRAGPGQPGWARVVLQLRHPVALDLVRQTTRPEGVFLDLRLSPVTAEAFAGASAPNAMSALWSLPQPTTPVLDAARPQPLRVAVDPGHGGRDSGAVEGGLRESDLMLDFAHELTEKLIRAGFEVVLTRRSDVFTGLETRMTTARAAGADLFISLHADALPEGQATGAAIFTWNPQADDRASRQLATRHDRADLVTGVDLAGADDQIAATVMEMARADTQPRSEIFAKHLSAQLAQAGLALHRNPVKGAAFSVLKSPDIPSTLIELGFLTDPGDRADLTDAQWRTTMTQAIARAVQEWAADDSERAALRRH